MWVRGLSVGVLGLVMAAVPVAAQRPGSVELGLFGQATKFDDALRLNGAFGVGGRLGLFVLPGLAVEADIANARPGVLEGSTIPRTNDNRSSYAPIHVRLAYNMMLGWRGGLVVGAGMVRSDYGVPYAFGASGLVGLRVGLTNRVQLRVDGLVDHMGKSVPEATTNMTGRIGISFVPKPIAHDEQLREIERPGDIDGDRVLDNVDECRDTPAGVRVDARGCTVPIDSDGDGIVDAADRCVGTPAGTRVDANGCPAQAPRMAEQDTDRDGVMDSVDRCGGTPTGTTVDATGCPAAAVVVDTDADGVADAADRCAGTAAGERVDANGCPLPKDADNDGVMDANDRCANTPAGTTVDATGCQPPPPDADKDGVADNADQCLQTAEGFTVDASGCPAAFREGVASVVLSGVTFEEGRAALTAQSGATLDAIATILLSTNQRVEVAVHTDNAGSARANDNVSQSRALAIRSYLIGKGVPAANIVARGYGGKQPVAENTTEEGRARNRRVEIRRL